MNQKDPRELWTPIGILSYPVLDVPLPYKDGKGDPRYSANLLFVADEDPRETLRPVAEILKLACREPRALHDDNLREIRHVAIRPAAEADQEHFGQGTITLKASNKRQPQFFGPHGGAPLDPTDDSIFNMFYAGARARFYVWSHAGKEGETYASLHLKAVQFAGHGDPIGGGGGPIEATAVPGADSMENYAPPAATATTDPGTSSKDPLPF